MNLSLDYDEGIILETNDATWLGESIINLQRLILTNRNIYCLYRKSNGLFSKATEECAKMPLSEIKIINGQPMVNQVKDDYYGMCLQIQFIHGNEIFAFYEAARRNSSTWKNELWKLLIGEEAPTRQAFSSFGNIGGGLGDLAASFKNVADSAMQTVSATAKQVVDQASQSYESAREQIQASKQLDIQAQQRIEQMYAPTPSQQAGQSFCSNCGNKLIAGAKFCPSCGKAVSESLPTPPSIPQENMPTNPTSRQQAFAGSLLKCPNCGAVISQTTAICPECGHHITGQAAVGSVQAFNDQLMLLETRRKRSSLGQVFGFTVDPVDNQKLTLIRSFPIPNTIDDIQEFMLLAIANIDVGLSKNTWSNRYLSSAKSGETNLTMPKTISDAWVAKMKQAYQKALATFPNDPAFSYIKQIYSEKMAELKMKID